MGNRFWIKILHPIPYSLHPKLLPIPYSLFPNPQNMSNEYPVSPLRQEIIVASKTIVIKVGSRCLTDSNRHLDHQQIKNLVDQIYEIIQTGRRVILVSSGAVAAGMDRLKLTNRPKDLGQLQAVAAVGQSALIEAYNHYLTQYNIPAAQALLTNDDMKNRTRYLNMRNTLNAALDFHTLPVINENDTISVDELKTTFGDNDNLAALVANLVQAELLILLSDIDGLYNGDPSDPNSHVIQTVTGVEDNVKEMVHDHLNSVSKGGMSSKLRAAQQVNSAGCSMIIAKGRDPNILRKIFASEEVGTVFLPHGEIHTSRQNWLGFASEPLGSVFVDHGAVKALQTQGRSLLPKGIKRVYGRFDKGDVISICNAAGDEFARGLSNYSSDDIQRIRGLHSDEIEEALGRAPYEEVVHRDNIALRYTE